MSTKDKELVKMIKDLISHAALLLSIADNVRDRYNLINSIREFNNILYRKGINKEVK